MMIMMIEMEIKVQERGETRLMESKKVAFVGECFKLGSFGSGGAHHSPAGGDARGERSLLGAQERRRVHRRQPQTDKAQIKKR